MDEATFYKFNPQIQQAGQHRRVTVNCENQYPHIRNGCRLTLELDGDCAIQFEPYPGSDGEERPDDIELPREVATVLRALIAEAVRAEGIAARERFAAVQLPT